MKLLMTVQPKNGEKPSEPVIVDTDESSLYSLAVEFLRDKNNVLIFQPVAEYKTSSWEKLDKKE